MIEDFGAGDIVKIEPIITTECSNSALYVESKKAKKEREKVLKQSEFLGIMKRISR